MGKVVAAMAVLVLLVTLAVGDVGARNYTEHQLEQRIDTREAGAASQVKISGFPFLGKLVAQGRVDKITAHLSHASEGSFVLDQVDITVTGAKINLGRFVRNRQLEIQGIDRGVVVGDMSQADFDRLVGLPIVLDQGAAHVTVAGLRVSARVSIVNGRLQVAAAGLPASLSFPIPALPVLPCPVDVNVVPGHLIASCTFHEIPAALRIIS